MAFAAPESITEGGLSKRADSNGTPPPLRRELSAAERERRQRQNEREQRRRERQLLILEQKKKLLADNVETMKPSTMACYFDEKERRRREEAEHREWQLNYIHVKRNYEEQELLRNRLEVRATYEDFASTMRSREVLRKERVYQIRETQRRGRSLPPRTPPSSLPKPREARTVASDLRKSVEEVKRVTTSRSRLSSSRPTSRPVPAERNQSLSTSSSALPSRFAQRKRTSLGSKQRGSSLVAASTPSSTSNPLSQPKVKRSMSGTPKSRSARSRSTPPTSDGDQASASSKMPRPTQSRPKNHADKSGGSKKKKKPESKKSVEAGGRGAAVPKSETSSPKTGTTTTPPPPPSSNREMAWTMSARSSRGDSKESAPPPPPVVESAAETATALSSVAPATPEVAHPDSSKASVEDTSEASKRPTGTISSLEESALNALGAAMRMVGSSGEQKEDTSEASTPAPTKEVSPVASATTPKADAVSPVISSTTPKADEARPAPFTSGSVSESTNDSAETSVVREALEDASPVAPDESPNTKKHKDSAAAFAERIAKLKNGRSRRQTTLKTATENPP
jgi:hypothetical protein